MTVDFGKWALDNKKLVYFLVAVLVAGGLLSAYRMGKLEDPEVKVKTAMVVAVRPGASASEMELEVTDDLEKAVRTIGDVKTVKSWSYNDLAILQVELKSTTKDSDLEQCWDMLRRKVGDAAVGLPDGTSVKVQDDFSLVYGMFYALTGEGYSDRELSDYATLVQRELTNIDGVARVQIYGELDATIDITLQPERMASLGVSPMEVLATLKGQSGVFYAGYFDSGDKRVRVTVDDKLRTVEQIRQMVIQGHEDDQLRLADIAAISTSYAQPVRNSMTHNGKKALGIAVAAASGTDIVKLGGEVEQRLTELISTRMPVGIECEKVFYQPERVTDALGTFFINLIESVLIVIAVLMLTMGIRSGMIIGISLVTIVAGSFLLLDYFGGTMQRVSLASFILAMGMLVDNAIVIVDGILIDLKQGKPRREALISIGCKTAMPLLGATLIAILAFLPVFLSPDTAGVYVRDLFIVLAVSLMLSWILALVHVPLMADRWIVAKKTKRSSDDEPEAKLYDGKVYQWLRRLLSFGLRHRISSVVGALVLVALSVVGFRYVKQGFFPDMTYDQLYMEYKLPEGTNSTRVAADLRQIEQYLSSREEITDITASVGGTPARYNLVRSIATPSLAYGELIISFTSAETLDENIDEIQEYLTANYPDAYVKLKKYNIMYKKYPIEVSFIGPDPAVLNSLADSARLIMEQTPEVCLITTDWDKAVPVMKANYNQTEARRSNLSRENVSLSLLTATGGIPIGTFYEGRHENTIYLKCAESDGSSVDNLENVPIFPLVPNISSLLDEETLLKFRMGTISKDEIIRKIAQTSSLGQLGEGITIEWEHPVIPRYNGQRAQTVMCSPALDIPTEAARQAIAAKIEQLPLPAGYSLYWGGEREAHTDTMHYLFMQVPLGIVLIIAVLIMLFGDYRKPMLVLCCIPLLAIGVVAGMLIADKTFNFCSIVGALGLVGMLLKNCIVLLDEVNDEMRRGIEPVKALIESSCSRLRPVMMASLTTILGMIPLLGDDLFGSMAATIMGGLLFSTLATLFYLPILYALFFKIKPNQSDMKSSRTSAAVMAVAVMAVASPLCANAQTSLSLDECLALAKQHNKKIAAADLQVSSAEFVRKSARSSFFPSFSLEAMGVYANTDGSLDIEGGMLPVISAEGVPTGNVAYFPGLSLGYELDWMYGAAVKMVQPIYMGGKVRAGYRMSQLGEAIALQNRRLTESEVVIETSRAYASLVRANELHKVAVSYNALLTELKRAVEKAHKAGAKPKNDVLKVEVKLNESVLNLRRAENAMRLATMNLCHYIGRPLTDSVTVGGGLSEKDYGADLGTDISLRPEVTMLASKSELMRQKVNMARSERLPQVGLMAQYGYTNGLKINGTRLFDRWSMLAGVQVSVPLFAFGNHSNKVRAAKAQYEQSLADEADAKELLALEAMQMKNNLDEATLEICLAESAVESAEENLRASRRQYEVGTESLSDYLESHTLWQEAETTLVEARVSRFLRWMEYCKTVGIEF